MTTQVSGHHKKGITIYDIAVTALFAALCYVATTFFKIEIPTPVGRMMMHAGNIFCLLSGFVLGPVAGGLAAGLGSALYDVTNPAYIASAPFTFAFKFLLAAVCGWVAYARGSRAERHGQNILAGVAGSAAYMVLYLGKSFIEGLLLGNALVPVLVAVGTKAVTSGVNAVIAVVVSVPLCAAVRMALKKSHLLEKLG